MRKSLGASEKYNVMWLQNIEKVEDPKKFIDIKFYDKKKNVILIDNINN